MIYYLDLFDFNLLEHHNNVGHLLIYFGYRKTVSLNGFELIGSRIICHESKDKLEELTVLYMLTGSDMEFSTRKNIIKRRYLICVDLIGLMDTI